MLKERNADEQLLLKALIFSLALHLLLFGTWRGGKDAGWWHHAALPKWIHVTPALLKPLALKKVAPPPRPSPPPQLTFIDVDPALADATPPKAPKFYSANNSSAANPHPKKAATPEINGHQTRYVKTTDNVKLHPEPMHPSPPRKEPTAQTETKPAPQKTYVPGDLAMAKPREKAQEGTSITVAPADAQPTPKPEPVHTRPRTIAEAMAQHGITGERSHQEGGVQQLRMDSTVDAVKTPYGDYDQEFIDAVRNHWYQLLENVTVDGTGKVVIEFRLLPDGRITHLQIAQTDMSDLLSLVCQRAIQEPAPYKPWPLEMRSAIPKEYRDVTFTFYYSTE
jgi:hypothetical protein